MELCQKSELWKMTLLLNLAFSWLDLPIKSSWVVQNNPNTVQLANGTTYLHELSICL